MCLLTVVCILFSVAGRHGWKINDPFMAEIRKSKYNSTIHPPNTVNTNKCCCQHPQNSGWYTKYSKQMQATQGGNFSSKSPRLSNKIRISGPASVMDWFIYVKRWLTECFFILCNWNSDIKDWVMELSFSLSLSQMATN